MQAMFDLGLSAGYDIEESNLLGLQAPGALIANKLALLNKWLEGIKEGRELRLSSLAENSHCECSISPPDKCLNHFDDPAHARRAAREVAAWREKHACLFKNNLPQSVNMQNNPKPTPQVSAAGLQLEDKGTCPMCDGTGGWPGVAGRVECKPCKGTGLANGLPPQQIGSH